MRKLIVLDDGTKIVHNGVFFTGSSPEIVEEYSISDDEFVKAKKDKKFLDKLTKDKKGNSIKAETFVEKNE